MRLQIKSLLVCSVPWVLDVFIACGGNFRCWPKADTSSAVGRSHERRSCEKTFRFSAGKAFHAGHYEDLTETGNRARTVSGTQGICSTELDILSSGSLFHLVKLYSFLFTHKISPPVRGCVNGKQPLS